MSSRYLNSNTYLNKFENSERETESDKHRQLNKELSLSQNTKTKIKKNYEI